MEKERAKEITAQCVRAATWHMFDGEGDRPKLPPVSLEELLVANRTVRELNATADERQNPDGGTTKTIHVHVADRLVAAFYAFENYGSNPAQLLESIGYTVTHDGDEEP